jgi:hypothetical protein
MLTKELPRGIHQYKFIVDTNWRFSQYHPTINDGHGNINNVIESNITYIEPKKVSSFSNYYPHRNVLQFDALPLPEGYKDCFSACNNCRQSLFGKRDLINKENYYSSENASYGIIYKAPHINMYD